jgi:DNA polymerase-3 subunit delta
VRQTPAYNDLVPRLTTAALRKQIASGDTDRLYLLIGDDEAEKTAVAAEFADMIDEDLRPFNLERLYGGEIRVRDLAEAAATLPMMAPRRLVTVVEAEKLLIPRRDSKAMEEEQERLEAFLQSSPGHATIVFVCGALDLRFRLVKRLVDEAQVVDCGTISDAEDAQRWVKARAARERIPVDAVAVRTLVERAGRDIVALRAGLERLSLYALGQEAITADDVRQVVPVSPEEQENFGIANAIARNDAAAALHELHLALDAGTRPEMIVGQLRVAGERLPGARLRAGIGAIFRADTRIKSSAGDARMVLERLVLELCGTRRRA